jgi:hypothetical protein
MQGSVLYTNPVRTSQETHYVSATETNRLMLFRETVAVYCKNHVEYTTTLSGQNTEAAHEYQRVSENRNKCTQVKQTVVFQRCCTIQSIK